MEPWNISQALENLVLLYDTREQPTDKLKKRLRDFGGETVRTTLNFGDYSVGYRDGDQIISFQDKIVVERKNGLDELAMCLGKQRDRFCREFLRAAEKGATVYLLVENASWEKLFAGDYRSRMSPQSLIGSLIAWSARYKLNIIFCKAETTGKLLRKILHYNLRDILEREEQDEPDSGGNQGQDQDG